MRQRHPRPPAERAERTRFVGADQFEQFECHWRITALPSCPAQAGHPVRRGVPENYDRLRLLDHPLEPVIGRRAAPTRWRMMTAARYLTTAAVCPNKSLRSSSV